jgi:predicted glycosyltransferase involved in capsule biosynthesis
MDFTICIPWRDTGCAYRRSHFEFLKSHYSSISRTLVVDSSHEVFNRANARNRCVELSPTDVVLVVDADNYLARNQVLSAVDLLLSTQEIVRPFTSIHYLNELATKRFLSNIEKFSPTENDYEYMSPDTILLHNAGGAYMTTKYLWNSVGGMDEGFRDWGVEDLAFNDKYWHYGGRQFFVDGPNYNLHHPAERLPSRYNEDRYSSLYLSKKIYDKDLGQ